MKKMVTKWLNKGFINQETAEILLKDIEDTQAQKVKTRLNILIYTVAAIFIGIGVISFIAANDWLLKLFEATPLLKIIAISTATLVTFYGGYTLAYEKNNFPKLGHSLIFLSALLIGGTYALIGQQYHFNANSSSIYFLWLISIIPIAYIFKNFAINILSIVIFILGTIFYYNDVSIDRGETWTIFIPILIGTTLYTIGNIPIILNKYNKFSLSYKLTGLAPIFTTLLILTCSVAQTYHLTSPLYLVPLVLLIIANNFHYQTQDKSNILLKIETTFLTTLLLCLILMLCCTNVSESLVIILANIAIITIISIGYKYGYQFEQSTIIGLTNWFLIIYLLTNYCRWAWNFMDKAAFFFIGGICLLTLGIYLEKKRKLITKKG